MRRFGFLSMRRFLKDQRGQAAVVVMLTASGMMALAGASIETGHVYYAYQQLVASTNAAALAGAQAMPNTTTASTNVTTYSSQTGELNATAMLTNVVATPTFLCLGTVSGSLKVPCSTSTGASGGYNALSVKQTATIPLWFGGLIGMQQMNVAANSDGGDARRAKRAVEHRDHPGRDAIDGLPGQRRAMQRDPTSLRATGDSGAVGRSVSLPAEPNMFRRRALRRWTP